MGILIDNNKDISQEKLLRGYMQHLLNSLVSIKEYRRNEDEIEKIKTSEKESMERNNVLITNINDLLASYRKMEWHHAVDDAEREIKESVDRILGKIRNIIKIENENSISDLKNRLDVERTNCIANIQAFLSMNIINDLDSTITVKYTESGYRITSRYVGEGDIEYSFALDAKDQDIFSEVLRFGHLEKNMKIPISENAGDSDLDYEKIDRFYLSNASISKGSFLATFSSPENDSKVTFVMSRGNISHFISVEYSVGNKVIDITGNSAIVKRMEVERVQEPLDRIYGSILELENSRVKLIELSMNKVDIFRNNNFEEFILKLFQMKSKEIKNSIGNSQESSGQYGSKAIEEKLSLCGEIGGKIAGLIGVNYEKN